MRPRVAACVAALLLAMLGGCDSSASRDPGDTESGQARAAQTARTDPGSDEGFDPKVLDRLAEEAQRLGSNCFLVARQGRVVLARYWNGAGPESAQEVFSVTKSLTSTLVGLAQAGGDLSIDDPAAVHIDDWRGTPSGSVTVRHLLANVSGRFWSAESDYGDLVEAADRTAYALGLEQQAEPGTVWVYNNAAIQTLDAVLRSATGTDPASYAADRLFGPLGMAHTRMTGDSSGRSTNMFFGMQSTCADLARFGTLFAQEGEWNGEQLVPRDWVEEATGGPSQELNAAYGLLWWVNRSGQVQPGEDEPSQFAPGAPERLFAAQGLGGQVVLVDPRTDVVVVRLGDARDEGPQGYQLADAAHVVTEAWSGP